MNIFVLSADREKAAQYHCDKHVVKMIVEYAQLLSTAHRVLDGDAGTKLRLLPGETIDALRVYRATHINHPCAVWVRQSYLNYLWLLDLLQHLIAEFEYRYGHGHSTSRLIPELSKLPANIPQTPFTTPAMAMPDAYRIEDSVVEAYRDYYIHEKAAIAQWTKRGVPHWFTI